MTESKKYTINGETMTVTQFAVKHNLSPQLIRQRINLGWTYPDIFTPLQRLGYKRIKHNGSKII